MAEDGGATIATAYVQLVPTLKGAQGAIGKEFGSSSVQKEAEDTGKSLGTKLGAGAVAGIAAGAAAAGGALAGLYKIGSTFDDVADTIAVATGKSGAALDGLVGQAKEIGTTIPVEFEKIGPALSTVSQKMGLAGDDLTKVTEQFLALGNLGQEINMDTATGALNAFGVAGSDVSGELDKLFKISQATGTGMDAILSGVQGAAPALQQLGFSLDDSAILFGQLDKAGLNASGVLNGMGKGLVKLAKDGEQPQEAFGRITGQISDLVAQGKDAEAIDLASGLFGTKNAAAFVEATKSGAVNVGDLKAQLEGASGSILQAQTDTADFAEGWQLAKNKLMAFLEPLGSGVFGLAGDGMAWINSQLDVLLPSLTNIGTLLATGNLAEGGIFGQTDSPLIRGLTTARDTFIETKDTISAAWTLLKTGDFVGGTGLGEEDSPLVTALLNTRDKWQEISPQISEAWQVLLHGPPVGGDANAVASPLMEIALAVRDTFKQVWDQIGPIFTELWKTLGPALMDAFKSIWEALKPLIPVFLELLPLFNPFSLIIHALLPIMPQLVDVVADLATMLGGVLSDALIALEPVFQTLVDAATTLMPVITDLFAALLPVLPPIVKAIGEIAKALAGGLIKAVEALTPLFTKLVGVIVDLAPFIGELIAKLLPPFIKLFEKIAPLVTTILDAFIPLVELLADALIPVIEALMPVFEGVFTFIADTINNVITVIGGFIDIVMGIFSGDFSKVWEGIKTVFGGIWDQIVNVFTNLIPVILEFGGKLLGWLWDGLKAAVPAVLAWFGTLPGLLWEGIVALAGWLGEKGGEFLAWLWHGSDGNGGLVGKWNEVVEWFAGLPAALWESIQAGWQQIIQWGSDFIKWIWEGTDGNGGIVGKWKEVVQWFKDLPQNLWIGLQETWQKVVQWGTDFIGWLWEGTDGNGGLKGKWDEVVTWFENLPGELWKAIEGIWKQAAEWGGALVSYIVAGISGSDPYIAAELARTMINAANAILPIGDFVLDIAGVDLNKNIDDYLAILHQQSINESKGLGGPRHADGGLFGPVDGSAGGRVRYGTGSRSDNVMIRGSRNEFMVNASDTMRTLPWLMHINQGGSMPPYPGFADGGLVGYIGRLVGGSFIKSLLPQMTKGLTDSIESHTPTVADSNGNWGPDNFGGLAANTAAARAYIMAAWGLTNIGGFGGGSVSNSDHPRGKALDVMIPDYRSSAGIALGTAIADWFIAHPNAFGLKYLIWRDRIYQNGSWTPYSHPSGSNDTLQHRDHVHLSFLTGAGAFNGAGATPLETTKSNNRGSSWLSGLFGKLAESLFSKIGSLFGFSGGGGGGVEQWRPLALQALTEVGAYKGMNLTGFIGQMMNQIMTESSGDPNAINTDPSDINFQRGDPSIGLLQVIGSTFRSALSGTPFEYLIARGQRDPYASLVASTLYSLARYGSLARAWQGVPYDQGGWLMPGLGQVPVNMLRQPEPVLTPDQWRIAEEAIDRASREGERTGNYVWNVYPQEGQAPADIAREMDRLLVFSGR